MMSLDAFGLNYQLFLTADIAGATENAVKASQGLSDEFWNKIFQGGLFGQISNTAQIIAGMGFLYRGYQIIQEADGKSVSQGEVWKSVLKSLFVLALISIMFAKNGALSKNSVLALKNYTDKFSERMMTGIANDREFNQMRSASSGKLKSQPIFQNFNREAQLCVNSATKQTCFQRAVDKLNNEVRTQGITDSEILTAVANINAEAAKGATPVTSATPAPSPDEKNWWDNILDIGSKITSFASDMASNLVALILQGMAIGFFLAIDITMLLFGLTFPINLGLSLYDNGESLKTWLGNFWTLANAKICFSIVTGIIVYLQIWSESGAAGMFGGFGLFVIELLMAIFVPVITYYYCQGTALAMSSAMNSMSAGAVKGTAANVFKLGKAGGKMGLGKIKKMMT
jgi:hypothetical protein